MIEMRRIDEIIADLEANCDSPADLKRCVQDLAAHIKNVENTLIAIEGAWELMKKLRAKDERQQQLFEKDAA